MLKVCAGVVLASHCRLAISAAFTNVTRQPYTPEQNALIKRFFEGSKKSVFARRGSRHPSRPMRYDISSSLSS